MKKIIMVCFFTLCLVYGSVAFAYSVSLEPYGAAKFQVNTLSLPFIMVLCFVLTEIIELVLALLVGLRDKKDLINIFW